MDDRPRFAIGHVSMTAGDATALAAFYTGLGMRLVVNMDRMSILELRGGTHLVLRQGPSGQGSLDLVVDDIDGTHDDFQTAGAAVTPILRGNPHDRFSATDPEGNMLTINSNHAMGPV